MRLTLRAGIVAILGIYGLLPHHSFAAPIVFTGSSGNLASTVQFDVSGSNLLVSLDNSSSFDVLVPSDVMTAVFFDITGSPTLTPIGATISAGSSVVNGSAPGGDVGGAWAYKDDLSGAPGGGKYGISSSGLNLVGPHDVFPGADPDPGNGPAGMGFGLLSAGDDTTTGNSPILSNPFVKHKVDFVLSGLPASFSLSSIGNVHVQYGTAVSTEPSYQVLLAPEPASGLILWVGAITLSRRRMRLI